MTDNTTQVSAASLGEQIKLTVYDWRATITHKLPLSTWGEFCALVDQLVALTSPATQVAALTDERILEMWSRMPKHHSIVQFARAILSEAGTAKGSSNG